ncbi:hypothetical protein MNBD_ALPHA04-167, partial [hydrothermal vent metagenome]
QALLAKGQTWTITAEKGVDGPEQ